MKNMKRRAAALAMTGVMALGLAACSGGGSSSLESASISSGTADATSEVAATGSSEGEDVTIRITWWGGESRHEYTQQMLDKYTELHPNVHFEATPAGWDGYFEKLATDTATGSMPDIVQMDYLYISTYAANNSLADLTPYIEDGTLNVGDVDANLMQTGNIDGKQIAMPLSSSLMAVGYSPAALEAAGLEEPTADWTWSDFATMCNTIYEKTGNVGTTTGPVDDTNIFNYWVRQHGAQLFSDDNKSLGFEDDSITADFFQMWKDMMDAGGAPDPDEYDQIQTLGLEAEPIANDESGFRFNWNNYTTLMANSNDTLKMVTPPMPDDGSDNKGLWLKPGMFFSVAETSEVKEECVKFIDWFINSEEANEIMMGERGAPASSAMRDYLVNSGKLSEQQQQMFSYVDEATALCGDTPAPDPVGISEVNQAFKDAAYSVFYGQASADEAAASFREEANSILSSNN